MINNKTILSKRYNQTIINAYLLESEWFNEKFSVEDIQTVFNWKNFIKDIKTEVYVIQDDNDSILDYRDTLEAVKYAKENHLPWKFFTEVNGDHVPLSNE
ncbi:hypothetical protein JQ509_002659 [Staphylococcus pseudintermedius]|nr:hypothetical protein [Staphylococcus pseudintermedius]EHD5264156.1 hypothetical protein [Staphylococcus pseudintermedius]